MGTIESNGERNQILAETSSKKVAHLMYVPFTGLGLYGGFRGNRWLRNRIKIFKQFVVPSLLAQSNQDFIVWVSWREEERNNQQVKELERWLKEQFEKRPSIEDARNFGRRRVVFTYSGVCFWDDKYVGKAAYDRLANALHGAMGELQNVMGEAEEVYMTIQPSDDCYYSKAIEQIQTVLATMKDMGAVGFQRGYITNYGTRETRLYNPGTNPPFYTVRFPSKDFFVDPLKHMAYTAIKSHTEKYPYGTPIPSHEYVGLALNYGVIEDRGFMVGTHGENISTVFNHPFAGDPAGDVWGLFGLENAETLLLPVSWRKKLMRKLPPWWQRKLRYLVGERIVNRIYNFLRS